MQRPVDLRALIQIMNGFQQTYRSCTPAATVAIRRYIEEGSKISRDLTARYAN